MITFRGARLLTCGFLAATLLTASNLALHAQSDAFTDLPLVDPTNVPPFATFYSLSTFGVYSENSFGPPLPWSPCPDCPVYYLGSNATFYSFATNTYVVDDTAIASHSGGGRMTMDSDPPPVPPGGDTGSGGDNEIVANNIIVSNAFSGIQVAGYQTVSNMKIYNNTIAWNRWGSGIILWQAVNGVDIANNIIYGHRSTLRGGAYGIKTCDCTGSGLQIRNNLFNFNYAGDWNLYWTCETGSNIGDTAAISNNKFSNPLFFNDLDDWHVQSGSEAINTGATLIEVTTDFDGKPRPTPGESYCDMGAYQH